jgi:hypothetical protein
MSAFDAIVASSATVLLLGVVAGYVRSRPCITAVRHLFWGGPDPAGFRSSCSVSRAAVGVGGTAYR